MSSAESTVVVRRTIRARPDDLFAAWTTPEHLLRWFGPTGAACIEAHVDLTPGGEYRLANAFPDGRVVRISGCFESIERPRRLVYSWRLDIDPDTFDHPERVTVTFEPIGADVTEVCVVHERIADAERRRGHQVGWIGCFDGLEAFMAARRTLQRWR